MTGVKSARAERLAELNDQLRKNPLDRSLGQVLIISAIDGRGSEFKVKGLTALARIRGFQGRQRSIRRTVFQFLHGRRQCLSFKSHPVDRGSSGRQLRARFSAKQDRLCAI